MKPFGSNDGPATCSTNLHGNRIIWSSDGVMKNVECIRTDFFAETASFDNESLITDVVVFFKG